MIKKFLRKLFFILIPTALFVASINYFIDPAHIYFSKNYLNGMADVLSLGHNVDNVSNFDERLLQEQLIKRINTAPDLVLLGSSRIMQIGSDFFPHKHILNLGVSHANIRDIIAITGVLDSMQKLPKEVVINVDAALIGKDYSNEWKSLEEYYNYFIIRNGFASGDNFTRNDLSGYKYLSIFSIEYMQAALEFIVKKRSSLYLDIGSRKPVLGGRYPDGSIEYDEEYKNGGGLHKGKIELENARREGIVQPDKKQVQLLIILLDYFTSRNVKVELCLMPYHPALYSEVNRLYDKSFIKYENYYRELAQKRNLRIFGSFDPGVLKLMDTDFYDMYHCSRLAIRKSIIN